MPSPPIHLFALHSAAVHGAPVAGHSASAGAVRLHRARPSPPQSWVTDRYSSPGRVEEVTQRWRDREEGPCHCCHHKGAPRRQQEGPGCQTGNRMGGGNIPGHLPTSLPMATVGQQI